MGRLTVALAGLLIVSAAVSTKLWFALKAERALVGEATTGAWMAEINRPSASRVQSGVAAPFGSGDPAAACESPGIVDRLAEEEFLVRLEAVLAKIPPKISGMPDESVLLMDPEYRKARLAQMRIAESLANPELATALGISDAEATRLFELMAESQLNAITQLTMSREKLSGAALAEAGTKQLQNQEESVRALLGPAKYAQLRDYRMVLNPALIQVANFAGALAEAGHPLTEVQSQSVRAAMIDHHRRQASDYLQQKTVTAGAQGVSAAPRSSAQIITDQQAGSENRDYRAFEVAAANLSAAQVDVLRRHVERRAGIGRRLNNQISISQ